MILSLYMYGCSNEEIINEDIYQLRKSTISSNNLSNYLTFKSYEEIDKILELIKSMDYEQQISWENNLNFISVNRIYEEINIANNEQLKPYEDKYEEMSVDELSKIPYVAPKIRDEFKDVLITEKMEDGFIYDDINISIYELSKIVNRNGIVKVGDKIYQYKKYTTKIIEDGDESKIPLLNSILSSDDELKITVIDLKSNSPQNFSKSAYKTNGVYKVIIYNDFHQKYQGDPNIYRTNFQIKMRVLRKAFGVAYFNHKEIVEFNNSFIGNAVTGFQISTNGSHITGYHKWTGSFKGPTPNKEHTVELNFNAAPYSTQVVGDNLFYHFNTLGNLPHIYQVNNYVSVKCSSKRTISFNLNYTL